MSIQKEDFKWSDDLGGNRLTQNKKIKGQKGKVKCYSFENYAQELFDIITDQDFSKNFNKDLEKGDIVNIIDIIGIKNNIMSVELESGLSIEIPLSREKKFIELFGYHSIEEFTLALSHIENKTNFLNQKLKAHITENFPSIKASLWQGHINKIKEEFMDEIKNPTKAYVAKILETNKGGYFVEVQGVNAFMPGSLSAPNKLNNFQDLVDTEVIVMIEDFIHEMNSFIVSHKKYIEYILPKKIKELDLDDEYSGIVTGTSKYGIFIEFNKIFTGLLHVSKMKEETLSKFKAREFEAGMEINFFINEITKDNRIILSEENPAEKRQKIEKFIIENKDQVMESKVAAIMGFGIIVEIEDHSGLIPNKEFRKRKLAPKNYMTGDIISVVFKEYKDGKITFGLKD